MSSGEQASRSPPSFATWTTVSGVQSAVATESLVSAALILTSSKIGDLFG